MREVAEMTSFRFVWTAARLGLDALRDGRLSMSPRRWLIDLRHLHGQMHRPSPPVPRTAAATSEKFTGRDAFMREAQLALSEFLAANTRLSLATSETPRLSILIVLFNRAELTLRCLRSIAEHVPPPFEVVIVDNGSTDDTDELLDRVDGAHVGRFTTNVGFLHGANTAALAARGEFLLFLNNDVELLPGAVASALKRIDGAAGVGAVGGRLVFPDGTLQEAGSIIWRDGSCHGYGRGDRPDHPQYDFIRNVDFSSAAFLLTRRRLFDDLRGFDTAYAPAYFEDADYCVRLWKSGHAVVYDPGATVKHLEFGSSSADEAADLQRRHRAVFVEHHRAWLSEQLEPEPANVLAARARPTPGQRILLVDDRVPKRDLGFGFPRAVDLVSALVADGHFVTLYPTDAVRSDTDGDSRTAAIPPAVEVAGSGSFDLRRFIAERQGYYDTIFVSRAHNMELVRSKLGAPSQWSPPARVVYDAEAIAAAREAGRRRLQGEWLADEAVNAMIDAEVDLARGVDAVIAVSEVEGEAFRRRGIEPVHVVSHVFQPAPTPCSFEARRDFLFVGSFDELSPNEDAVLWFAREVFPVVRRQLQDDVRFIVVGRHAPRSILDLTSDGVDLREHETDLVPLYDRARVFVAPSRFAAGIPYKIGHAAAHGLPVICTRLLQTQLEWRDGIELLAADDLDAFVAASVTLYTDDVRWRELRAAALARVADEYSTTRFRSRLRRALTPPIQERL
jgi:GT2 family glycosyltransferase